MPRAALLAIAMLLGPAAPAVAQFENYVDLELVLAVDVSRSMDLKEQQVQRRGYVDAFRHRQILEAIARGAVGKIVVTYVEWGGAGEAETVVPWMLVDGEATAEAFARALEEAPINMWRRTSISGGLSYSADQFDQNIYNGERLVIDVSGDGPNNTGLPVVEVRDAVVDRGITINGLPLIMRDRPRTGRSNIPNLDVYYEDCVIGGPGAFMVAVEDTDQFAEAIRRKLVLEIAALPLPIVKVAMKQREPRVDCLIGEKIRQQRWFDDP